MHAIKNISLSSTQPIPPDTKILKLIECNLDNTVSFKIPDSVQNLQLINNKCSNWTNFFKIPFNQVSKLVIENHLGKLPNSELISIFKAISENKKITHLSLRDNELNLHSELGKALSHIPESVIALDLFNNQLNTIPKETLINTFKQLPRHIKNLMLSAEDVEHFTKAELLQLAQILPLGIELLVVDTARNPDSKTTSKDLVAYTKLKNAKTKRIIELKKLLVKILEDAKSLDADYQIENGVTTLNRSIDFAFSEFQKKLMWAATPNHPMGFTNEIVTQELDEQLEMAQKGIQGLRENVEFAVRSEALCKEMKTLNLHVKPLKIPDEALERNHSILPVNEGQNSQLKELNTTQKQQTLTSPPPIKELLSLQVNAEEKQNPKPQNNLISINPIPIKNETLTPSSNTPILSKAKPPSKNISMLVLSGFMMAVGVLAVATAFVCLNLIALNPIGLTVLAVGVTMALAGVGLFAYHSKPSLPKEPLISQPSMNLI